jgi:hypothetical protein
VVERRDIGPEARSRSDDGRDAPGAAGTWPVKGLAALVDPARVAMVRAPSDAGGSPCSRLPRHAMPTTFADLIGPR